MAFRELKKVELPDQGKTRRWFSGDKLQLILWLKSDGEIIEFQLLYQAGWEDKALNWHYQEGFSHHNVDDGEGKPGKPKMSPILIADGYFNKVDLSRSLEEEGQSLEPSIREFVHEKILAYQFSKEITVGDKLQATIFTEPELKLTLGRVSVITLESKEEITSFVQQHQEQLSVQEVEFLGSFCWLLHQQKTFSGFEGDMKKELACFTGTESATEKMLERGMQAIRDHLESDSGSKNLKKLGTSFLEKKLEELVVPNLHQHQET